jgi:hypothetical protein
LDYIYKFLPIFFLYTGCTWNTCANFNHWKNSPIYETFLYYHFVKFKSFPRFLPPNFCRTSYFAWLTSLNFFVTMRMFIFISFFSITMTMFRFYHNRTFLSFLMANLFHILNQFFVKNSNSKNVSFNKLCCVLELTHAFWIHPV